MPVGDQKSIQREQDIAMKQAEAYRAALERAAYGDAGSQYGQGMDQITRYLAGAGPMADSGGATALKYKLASQVYGGARNRINSGYAQYLDNAMNQARQYRYNAMAQKASKPKWWQSVLGAAGGVAGAAIGRGGGGGGSDSADISG